MKAEYEKKKKKEEMEREEVLSVSLINLWTQNIVQIEKLFSQLAQYYG